MNKKIFILTAATVAALGGTLLVTGESFAQDAPRKQGHLDTLVQKIAQRFGLDQSEVQAVFDEAHTEMRDQLKKRQEDRLSQLVVDGKLTEAQKQLILEKSVQLQESREGLFERLKNMTPEERHVALAAERESIRQWAAEHEIPQEYLQLKIKHKGVSEGNGPGMKMIMPSNSGDSMVVN